MTPEIAKAKRLGPGYSLFATAIVALLCLKAPLLADDYDALIDECFGTALSEGDDCGCSWCDGTLLRWPGAEPTYENLRPDRIISDQPHIAESAAVVSKGTIQLEVDFLYTREASGGADVDNLNYPNFLLRWGMLCDWFELRLAWSYNDEDVFDPAIGAFQNSGADDLGIGSKIALTEQHGILPQLAIFPQMRVPTGGNQFSGDEVLPGMIIAYGWEIKEGLGLEVNTSFDRVQGDLDEFYTEILQVVNVGWDVRENIMLFSEVIGIWSSGSLAAKPQYLYQGGMQYYPNDDLTFYLHAGAGLNEAADNFFAGIGFAVRTP